MTNNLAHATDFLTMVIAGRIADAYQKYVDMQGKHHNVYFPAGFATLQKGMEDSQAAGSHKQFTIKQTFVDGDRVAVHSHLIPFVGGPEMTVVHMFRFENGNIVEFWDVGQMIPEEMVNGDGVF